jgi:murein L,D-transpeptidase YafK
MKARVWLIAGDILVFVLLLFSLALFLYPGLYSPPKPATQVTIHPPKTTMAEHNATTTLQALPADLTFSRMGELNVSIPQTESTLSLEEMLKLSQEVAMQEYLERAAYEHTPLKIRLKAVGAKKGDAVFIRIFKQEAVLEVWVEKDGQFVHLKDYPVCAYSGHLGPKLKEGDRQAPEGFYRVYKKQLNPHSRFHLAFNLGYPNAYDRAHHRTGSYLMVHGNCVSVGCYAMTDAKIEEIYALVASALKYGQPYVPVHIFPFRMDDEAMAAHSESRWYDFWMELKEGYDYFEAEEVPPRVVVENGHYVIKQD